MYMNHYLCGDLGPSESMIMSTHGQEKAKLLMFISIPCLLRNINSQKAKSANWTCSYASVVIVRDLRCFPN